MSSTAVAVAIAGVLLGATWGLSRLARRCFTVSLAGAIALTDDDMQLRRGDVCAHRQLATTTVRIAGRDMRLCPRCLGVAADAGRDINDYMRTHGMRSGS